MTRKLISGRDTCAGFIEYGTLSEVEKAVELFNGSEFNGSALRVMVGQAVGGGASVGGNQFSQLRTADREVINGLN